LRNASFLSPGVNAEKTKGPIKKESELLSFSYQLPTLKQAEHLLIAEAALNRSGGNRLPLP